MPDSPLISAAAAHALMAADSHPLCWVDCRFELVDTEAGIRAYQAGHLPGARYAHLDRDLSAPVVPGHTGRHPLPDPEDFAATLRQWGIGPATHVIAYDDGQGPFASRLWWMLHWVGHTRQSVLDGGFAQWLRAGYPIDTTVPTPTPGTFQAAVHRDLVVTADDIMAARETGALTLVDCRSAVRYAGHADPLDQPPGRIPGALNHPHPDSLDTTDLLLPPAVLKEKLEAVWGPRDATEIATYCGSGVSSCHVILAAVYAGLGFPRNYIGSWSHWITDPTRPTERSGQT